MNTYLMWQITGLIVHWVPYKTIKEIQMRNGLRTLTGVSAANTAKTHTITVPQANSVKRECYIRSLTVSTQGADPASDIEVDIDDNGSTIWSVTLRRGQVF